MEFPEFSERTPKPEFDRDKPASLFKYAKQAQEWIRSNTSEVRIPEAIDRLAEKLEQFVADSFDSLPEVSAVTRDVQHTLDVTGQDAYHVIESEPLPYVGDAALYHEHTIRGRLDEFHRGDANDLRVYVSTGETQRNLPGGIYLRLLSVSVENSEIRLTEAIAEETLKKLGEEITEQLSNYSQKVRDFATTLIRQLNDREDSTVVKLQNSSTTVAGIARNDEVSLIFVDNLIEFIKYKLHLDAPHDINAKSYRIVISEEPVASFKTRPGPRIFSAVVPQLGLIGETANKGIGLFFLLDGKPVQVPVQNITNLRQVG